MLFKTDEILWYNPPGAIWGSLGYAVPNFGDDVQTLNSSVAYIVSIMGRNLSAVMHHADASIRVPPTVNTLVRIHKLITRARGVLAGRAIPAGQPMMEAVHATPSPEVFTVYPVPYFKVRNGWLKEYCGLILNSLSEAMQHQDNQREYDFTAAFAGLIGQYLQRVYVRMATELLGVPLTDAQKPDYSIPDATFAAYDPSKWFTSTELIDVVPPSALIPTEDDLQPLTNGIPVTQLLGLGRYPTNQQIIPTPQESAGLAAGDLGTTATVAASFMPPPGP